ncbi:hypothetical protein MMC10_005837 [Thelotrema lepadinum]|nr:hypothetical protein [Thelotrema lepadinum]
MESPSTINLNTQGNPTASPVVASSTTRRLTRASTSLTALVTDSSPPSARSTSVSVQFTGTLTPSGAPWISMNLATATGTVQTAQAASSSTLAAHPVLNNSQIIGVSVAGGVLFLLAIGVVFFIFCTKRKRRDRRRDSGSSFGADEIIGASPTVVERNVGFHSPAVNGRPNYISPKAQQILGPDTNRWSLWHRPPKPQDIGLAITPRLDQGFVSETSPASIASYQTTSRLLPEKPIYGQVQAPSWRPAMAIPRKPVRFAEGVGIRVVNPTPRSKPSPKNAGQSSKSSPDSFESGPVIDRKPSDPFLRPPEGATRPKANQTGLRRASRLDLPRLRTGGLKQGTTTGWDQRTPPSVPRPVASYNPADYARVAPFNSQQTVWKPALQPAGRPSQPQAPPKDNYFPSHPQYIPYNPSAYVAEPTFNKYAPIRPARPKDKRPLTYLTSGSETSFEDENEPDDTRTSSAWPIPAAAQPMLSPVVESPRGQPQLRSPPQPQAQSYPHTQPSLPLSQIRYPPIPRKPSSKKTLRVSPAKPSLSPSSTPNPDYITPAPVTPLSAASRSRPSPPTPASIKRKPNFVLPAWETLPSNVEFDSQAEDSDCYDSSRSYSYPTVARGGTGGGPYELPAAAVRDNRIAPASQSAATRPSPSPSHIDTQRQKREHLIRQRRASPGSGSPGANDGIRGTAKWQVLCSPGSGGVGRMWDDEAWATGTGTGSRTPKTPWTATTIDEGGSARTPRTPRSGRGGHPGWRDGPGR